MNSTTAQKVNAKGGFSRLGEEAALRQIAAILEDETLTQEQAIARLRLITNSSGDKPRKRRGA